MKKLKIAESFDSETTPQGGGRYNIRIIQPCVGSSGIYIAENLAKSVHLFTAGTQMYLDHPTLTEDYERPERSVRDLAAKFTTDAYVGEDGSLYTEIYVYPSFDQVIREKWEDIGVSINAWTYGSIDPNGVVPPFDGVESVDFVTKAGAGGAILELLESARSMSEAEREEKTKETELDEAKFDEFAKSTADNFKGLRESVDDALKKISEIIQTAAEETGDKTEDAEANAVTLADAMKTAEAIAEAGLPEVAKDRVIKAVESGVELKEAIDTELKYMDSIRESVNLTPDKDVETIHEAAPVRSFVTTRKVK